MPDPVIDFVADDAESAPPIDFARAELHHETGRRRLVLPETAIQAGGPTTVAPGLPVEEREVAPAGDAIPAGMRESGRRMTVLPETTIGASVNDRGRITDRWDATAPASTGYEAREVVPDPTFAKADRTRGDVRPVRGNPSALQRIADWASETGDDLSRGGTLSTLAIPGAAALAVGADPEAAYLGARDAAFLGWADEYDAGIDQIARGVVGLVDPDNPEADVTYEADRDRNRAQMRAAEERSPGTYGYGEAVGTAPAMLTPGGATTALGRVAVAGGMGLGAGMVRGAGESEANEIVGTLDQPSVARDALRQGALEGGLSAIGAGTGEVAAPLVSRLARWVGDRAPGLISRAQQAALEARGIWGGRALDRVRDRRGGIPQMVADLDEAGAPLHPRPMPDFIDRMLDTEGPRVGRIAEEIDEATAAATPSYRDPGELPPGRVDVRAIQRRLDDLAREEAQYPIGGQQISEALGRQSEALAPLAPEGMGFRQAHGQRIRIDRTMRHTNPDPSLSTLEGQRAAVRRAVSDEMQSAADAAGRGPEWADANRRYALAAELDDVARGIERQNVQGGIAGAGSRWGGVGRMIHGQGLGERLGGLVEATLGPAGQQELRHALPGLQYRGLRFLAPRLRALGARGQEWARILEAAQQRGSTGLAAAHYMLMRSDPEYRQAVASTEAGGLAGEE